MRHLIYLSTIALVLFFSSCDKAGFSIDGTISDAQNLSVYFDEVNPISRTNSVIAKTETNGSGSFSLGLEEAPQNGIYRVRIGAKSMYLILDGTEDKINISGTLAEVSRFGHTVTGSAKTEQYISSIQKNLQGSMTNDQLKKYIVGEADPLVALMIGTQRFGDVSNAMIHQGINAKMQTEYPGSSLSTDYNSFAAGLQREFQRQQSLAKVKIGEEAPEITLPDMNGTERSLSDLKGNVVLLDFWASWCGPCRRENPNVVRVYDKYKDQGFTVFSVSLDGLDSRTKRRYAENQIPNQMRAHKQRWVDAIKKDNLKWESHVSDLKKWESTAASTYGVTSIPRTFLLDRDGRIAAINPRRNLEEAVQSLLRS